LPRRRERSPITFAGVVFRRHDFDIHDRFEKDRNRLSSRLPEGHRTGDLERHFRRVDVVVRAVVQDRADAGDRVARQDSALERFLDALLRRLDELARHRSADHLVDKLEPAFRHRLEAHLDVAVLTLNRRLPDELALGFRLARDRLAIRDLRLADVGGNAEFANMRSTMISRCSSPIPRMMVWFVSGSVWTLNVGSSCMSFASATPIFS